MSQCTEHHFLQFLVDFFAAESLSFDFFGSGVIFVCVFLFFHIARTVRTFKYVAVYCGVLQRIAAYCSVLQGV